uniref:Uncharacterized protein n=1 Tax=Knipowitschia caucasica TaxID=637954 RepID=A0AAV2JZR8_KNICA
MEDRGRREMEDRGRREMEDRGRGRREGEMEDREGGREMEDREGGGGRWRTEGGRGDGGEREEGDGGQRGRREMEDREGGGGRAGGPAGEVMTARPAGGGRRLLARGRRGSACPAGVRASRSGRSFGLLPALASCCRALQGGPRVGCGRCAVPESLLRCSNLRESASGGVGGRVVMLGSVGGPRLCRPVRSMERARLAAGAHERPLVAACAVMDGPRAAGRLSARVVSSWSAAARVRSGRLCVTLAGVCLLLSPVGVVFAASGPRGRLDAGSARWRPAAGVPAVPSCLIRLAPTAARRRAPHVRASWRMAVTALAAGSWRMPRCRSSCAEAAGSLAVLRRARSAARVLRELGGVSLSVRRRPERRLGGAGA